MKTKLNTITILFSLMTAIVFPALAHAQGPDKKRGDTSEEQRPPHEPPPQAYAKCKDKKEGDQVQIVTPREEKISATCTASPKGLFARPEHPPRGNMNVGSSLPAKK